MSTSPESNRESSGEVDEEELMRVNLALFVVLSRAQAKGCPNAGEAVFSALRLALEENKARGELKSDSSLRKAIVKHLSSIEKEDSGESPLLSLVKAASSWVRLASDDSPMGAAVRFAAASEVLSKESGPMADAAEIIGPLEYVIRKGWSSFLEGHASFSEDGDKLAENYANGPPTENDAFSWDMAFSQFLKETGADGRKKAKDIRDKSRERLARFKVQEAEALELFPLWLPKETSPAFPALVILGQALWRDIVRPRLEQAARKPPALVRLSHGTVTHLLSGPKVREEGGQTALDLGLSRPCVIRAELAASPLVARGIELFQSIHAHRVIRGLAFAAHERALAGELDPRVLTYEGGFAALAEACGIEGDHGVRKVRELLEAFAALDLPLPGGDSARGLLTFVYGEARRNRKAYLKIVAGLLLLPDYVHELQRLAGTASVAARREQDLIPLLPVPPVLGRANDAGSQATLQLRVMAHLRDHAPDLAEGRGAPLPLDTWTRLAEESHVPRSLASRLLPHWQEDHKDGPAVLKRVDRDRYTLGDAHAPARTFLEDGGRRSLNSSEAGRRSVAKRGAARGRVGQK